MAYSGKYQPKNPQKYKGDPTRIVYRSSWEARCMHYFDLNENIISWQSEEEIISYRNPLDKMGKIRRYFPDFVIKVRQKDGSLKTFMIEVKPESQIKPPLTPKRKTQKYINEVKTYVVNQAKWEAAKIYCIARGWTFLGLSEKDLGIKT